MSDTGRGQSKRTLAQVRGDEAEERVARYLAEKGFTILERKYVSASRTGEVDLIAAKGLASNVTFSLGAALLAEAVATAVFVGVILLATKRPIDEGRAPFVIGGTLAVLLLITIPVTNGSLNPARSTAAAILAPSWALSQLWLFWVAPLVGGAVAALLYRAFSAPALPEVIMPSSS